MNILELQTKVREFNLNIFTINDVSKLMDKDKSYLKVFLNNHVKKGNIVSLKRGYYALNEVENIFLYSKLVSDSYISLNSALEYYGLTTQIYVGLQLISLKRIRSFNVGDVGIQVKKISGKRFFGYKRMNHSIFVANLEKMLIDCIYYSDSVYISEINNAIKQIKTKINIDLLVSYLNDFGSLIVSKRLGYLLDINGIDIFDSITIGSKFDLLNSRLSFKGTKDEKWKLIIDEDLL